VILVSDGAETCNVDPCALGRELEAAGVDLTVHVVGFGLSSDIESPGLRCLAEATGGRYFSARNAGELSAALGETVAAPVAPPLAVVPTLAKVLLRATDLDGGPEIASGLTWTVKTAGGDVAFTNTDAGVVEIDIAPGTYDVTVKRASDGVEGTSKLEARAAAGTRTVTIPLEIGLTATLTVTPATAPAASTVSVAWTGPNRSGDYVTIVKPGASVNDYMDYEDTARGNPVSITAPNEPGDYEMRYVLGTPRRVLAATPVKVSIVEAAITVPASAAVASEVEITWVGPNYASDWITVVKPDTPFSAYQDYFAADAADHKLEMPVEPGAYEVRYVLEGKRVLARAPITVTDVVATLNAAETVAAGTTFDVTWTGPNYHADWITVVKPDQPAQGYASYVDLGAGKGSPIQLSAAAEPGTYEIRYVMKGKRVIARRSITVTEAAAP
jgi:Ca-activated chloride channel family protein